MPRSFSQPRPDRESREQLRSDTASVLHHATVGLCKMVAAEIGVSQSRVNKLIAGGVANPLELLAKWMDRLKREGVDPDAIDEIPRFLAQRRGKTLVDAATPPASPATDLRVIANSLSESAELSSQAALAAADGIDAAEAELLLPLAERHVERAESLRLLLRERSTEKLPSTTTFGRKA